MSTPTDRHISDKARCRQLNRPVSADVTPRWHDDAECRDAFDPEMFFPIGDVSPDPALRYCAFCPVITDCLRWALAAGVDGIWGGTTEDERRRMRRARR